MTDKEKFRYEMMDTPTLAMACQKLKVSIDKMIDEKIMANHRCEFDLRDSLTNEIRQAKFKLREMRKILKSRQMRLF